MKKKRKLQSRRHFNKDNRQRINIQYKDSIKHNINKESPIEKWPKNMNKHFTKEEMQMGTNKWKDAHLQSEINVN